MGPNMAALFIFHENKSHERLWWAVAQQRAQPVLAAEGDGSKLDVGEAAV